MSKVDRPDEGKIYHGVYSSTEEGTSGADNTWESLESYLSAISYPDTEQRRVAWVYVNNNWLYDWKPEYRVFPTDTASWISTWNGTSQHFAVPYVRMFMQSQEHRSAPDPVFTLDRIRDGDFDDLLHSWATAAKDFGQPVMVEWGGECNGSWVPWNGLHYGADEDAPKLYADAYRHIIDVMRDSQAENITWVFHINASDSPRSSDGDASWNAFENYYPGNDYVDWVGVSVYGPQSPNPYQWYDGFSASLDDYYDDQGHRTPGCISRIRTAMPDKPIAISEFGCAAAYPGPKFEHIGRAENRWAAMYDEFNQLRNSADAGWHWDWLNFDHRAADWAWNALCDLCNHWVGEISAFSWWNEGWRNPVGPPSEMRLQKIPALAKAFRKSLSNWQSVIQDTCNYH